jgi:hypothetical protein
MNCARMLAGLNQRFEGNVEMAADLNAIRVALNQASADELSALEGRRYELISFDTLYTRLIGIAGQPLITWDKRSSTTSAGHISKDSTTTPA